MVADSADLTTVATLDGVYRYVSPACHRLFGWAPAELEGHHDEDFVHRHDLPSFRAGRAALADAEGVETEGQLRILEALECDRAQGFLFAPSGAPAAVDELVIAGPKWRTPHGHRS